MLQPRRSPPKSGCPPEDTASQLKQGVYLTPEDVASAEWLGSEGKPGNIAVNLQNASQFLAEQKQIPAAAPLKTFQDCCSIPRGCRVSSVSDIRDAVGQRNAGGSGSAMCRIGTGADVTRSPRSDRST